MIDKTIAQLALKALYHLYDVELKLNEIQVQQTRKEFTGDFTLVVFPLIRYSKKSAEITANELGNWLLLNNPLIEEFNVIKGFLNLSLTNRFWLEFFYEKSADGQFGVVKSDDSSAVLVEFSSPNTNKPLHLGHIRNNLLGLSISRILEASGKNVFRVNLVNDRGIHICKSMIAWMRLGNGETPQNTGLKGDHLVGKYYVLFEKEYRKQIAAMILQGFDEELAESEAPILLEAKDLLRKWEACDQEVRTLWQTMNGWVYDGFEVTYERLGVEFDKTYYESDTYLLGKSIVEEGLKKGVYFRKDDGSIWVDLTNSGLDEKLLLRSDGTSVYITQDLGTAQLRYDEYKASKMIYVVGNEQNYHFDVLKKTLKKLEKPYADFIFHLSYGMVELPEGKMKSREGTVVDADDLLDEMYSTAKDTTTELGKIEGFSSEEADSLFKMIGVGALKYFILKVDPKKNMLFNPVESIDFNGNTGPFIQYTHARIQSLVTKGNQKGINLLPAFSEMVEDYSDKLLPKERYLLRLLNDYPNVVGESAETLNPALICNYVYDLAKEYNQYYQEVPVLKTDDILVVRFRLTLSMFVGSVIRKAMLLLGISVPDKM